MCQDNNILEAFLFSTTWILIAIPAEWNKLRQFRETSNCHQQLPEFVSKFRILSPGSARSQTSLLCKSSANEPAWVMFTEELKSSFLYLCGATPVPPSKGTGTSGHCRSFANSNQLQISSKWCSEFFSPRSLISWVKALQWTEYRPGQSSTSDCSC